MIFHGESLPSGQNCNVRDAKNVMSVMPCFVSYTARARSFSQIVPVTFATLPYQ